MQDMFDGPSALTSCSTRRVSTVPLQPLFLLNSEFVNARSKKIANKILSGVAGDERDQPEEAVDHSFMTILNRLPDGEEKARSVEFLNAAWNPDTREEILAQFCHALLNLNEFAYIP